MKKTKFYKCDVVKCQNHVSTPGAICNICKTRLLNDEWVIFYCACCGKISSIMKQDEITGSADDRFVPVFCSECSSWFSDDTY